MRHIRRLKIYLDEGWPLQFYIKHANSSVWQKVTNNNQVVRAENGDVIELRKITDWFVTYPSGEICNCSDNRLTPPESTFFFDGPVYQDHQPGFSRLRVRNKRIEFRHTLSRMSEFDKNYFATSITNSHSKPVRVTKFLPMTRQPTRWTDPGHGYYSPIQFREWYRVPNVDGWISPHETVTDPSNWGNGQSQWAYFFENMAGKAFIATTLTDPPYA